MPKCNRPKLSNSLVHDASWLTRGVLLGEQEQLSFRQADGVPSTALRDPVQGLCQDVNLRPSVLSVACFQRTLTQPSGQRGDFLAR